MSDKVIHTPLRDLYDILQKDLWSSHFFKQCFKVTPPHVLIEYQFFSAIWKTISDLRVFFVSLYYWNHLTSYICFELFLYKMPLYIVRIYHVTNVKLPEHQQTRWSEQARYLKFKWLQQTMTILLTNNEPFRQIGLFD